MSNDILKLILTEYSVYCIINLPSEKESPE